MKAKNFVDKLKDIATNYKTLYVMGCFGAPMTVKNKQRYINHHPYNRTEPTYSKILRASEDTFGFDCVCLIKGVLWGWNGKLNSNYGGAVYCSNGVPDIGPNEMIARCKNVSTDFSKIAVGEMMWMKDHCGVYIGDNLVVECTPAWEGDVQITGIKGAKVSHIRTWKKHGKLPWVEYEPEVIKPTMNTEKTIWDFLKKSIGNDYGVAGLMGNLQAESGLSSINLENYYESKLHFTDTTYTQSVDSGTYTNFVNDAAGYGLAQWTFWSRKQNLYSYCKQCGTSIGDLQMQLEYLIRELQGSYKSVWNTLKSATSVKQASDIVLLQFENPADKSDKMKNYRASLGQTFYDRYHNGGTAIYSVEVTASVLNVRSGPGTQYSIVIGLVKGTRVSIYDEQNGWGRIDSGWICLAYTKRV